MTTKTKAKRVLKDITFDHDNAHLALCGAAQGSANNFNSALVLKSGNFSPEAIQKMQAVKVTLDVPTFLQMFFGIWDSDKAEVLAALMGYSEPVETPDMEIKDWVAEQLQAFEIIKSLNEADSVEKRLSELTEQEYLAFLQDQEVLEKAMNSIKESESVKPENDTSVASEVSKEVSASKVKQGVKPSKLTKGKTMDVKTEGSTPEVVEKSAYLLIEKALEESKVQLEKAQATIAAFEQSQKEQVIKSKTAAVTAVVKDAKQAEVLAKAALLIEDQAEFDGFVAVVKQMQDQVEKSALFTEQGASIESTEQVQESAVAKILKSQYAK